MVTGPTMLDRFQSAFHPLNPRLKLLGVRERLPIFSVAERFFVVLHKNSRVSD